MSSGEVLPGSQQQNRYGKETQLLQLLRERPSGFLSGEAMSRRLKVSRTAVWKKVQTLRASGYEIEAWRRRGYRLVQSPDLLTPSEIKSLLKTTWMGRKIHYYPVIESTNSEAYRLAHRGGQEGEVVIAESQSQGRGRMGRRWFSPPSSNVYLSVILRPPIPPHQASLVTLMAAVATANAVENVSGLSPTIKWPNDIFLGSRKVGGLLNEIQSEIDRIHFVILGIGVNLNLDRRSFPPKIRALATSLKLERGEAISRKVFTCSLLEELERGYERFLREGGGVVLEAWRRKARVKGKKIKVTSFGDVWEGKAVDVDSDGLLILEMEDGTRRRVVAGDVVFQDGLTEN